MALAKSARIRRRSWVPGTGFTAAGSPVQGKTQVTGVLYVQDYTTLTPGISLLPKDIGLSTIDFITLQPAVSTITNLTKSNESIAAATALAVLTQYVARFDYANNVLIVTSIIDSGGGTTDIAEVADTTDLVIYFHAEGDSARAPVLS